MGFLRLIHAKHYARHKGRFSSLALKNSSDGSGISVIEGECAEQSSGTICAHIAERYPTVVGDPIIYWPIPNDLIPDGCVIERAAGDGDDCHYNVRGWEDHAAGNQVKALRIENNDFMVCAEDGPRHLSFDDLA